MRICKKRMHITAVLLQKFLHESIEGNPFGKGFGEEPFLRKVFPDKYV